MSFNQFAVEQSAVFPEVLSFTPSALCDFRGTVYTSYLKMTEEVASEKIM